MKKIKGFNFDTIKDKLVLQHIEKQGNQSRYIKALVIKDIHGTNIEEVVKMQVEKVLERKAKEILIGEYK